MDESKISIDESINIHQFHHNIHRISVYNAHGIKTEPVDSNLQEICDQQLSLSNIIKPPDTDSALRSIYKNIISTLSKKPTKSNSTLSKNSTKVNSKSTYSSIKKTKVLVTSLSNPPKPTSHHVRARKNKPSKAANCL